MVVVCRKQDAPVLQTKKDRLDKQIKFLSIRSSVLYRKSSLPFTGIKNASYITIAYPTMLYECRHAELLPIAVYRALIGNLHELDNRRWDTATV